MKAVQLHDKYTEEIIGTVLLKGNTTFEDIYKAWDKYHYYYNSNLDNEADIHDFVSSGNTELCKVLNIEFYQP